MDSETIENVLEHFPTYGLTSTCNKFGLTEEQVVEIIKIEYPHMFIEDSECGCHTKTYFCFLPCHGPYGIRRHYEHLMK